VVDDVERDEAVDRAQALERRAVGAGPQLELVAGPGRKDPSLGAQHLGRDRAPETVDLVLEEAVRRLQQPQPRPALPHERPVALQPLDQAPLLQARKRLPDRRPREAEPRAQVRLGGETGARLPAAARDHLLEQLGELEVERDRGRPIDPRSREVAVHVASWACCTYRMTLCSQDDRCQAPRARAMKILAVGDSYMPVRYFEQAFARLEGIHEIDYLHIDAGRAFVPSSPSELSLREYQGTPAELVERMAGVEVVAVQGAPVTDAVLDASSVLRLVCCARGGPVNVDMEAVSARGLPLVNTPGKNADAVADLTIAFLVMLARGLPKAQAFLEQGHRLRDNWEGARFMGSDLRRHVLGLVGFGQIGRRVAERALPFGISAIAYDPYTRVDGGVEQVETLTELLARADFVSLHARATPENENLIDAHALAVMKPGAFLVNTARETLVDEDALDAALASGRLAGAALDVVRTSPQSGRHRLLRHENVVLTPHLGGATHETLLQGAEMIADEIVRFAAGEPLVNVVNREAVAA
jgi:D-3-phosphoglycerate dehydrogenase